MKKVSSLLNLYARPPLTITHGKGCYLFDTLGNKYLDLTSGIAVSALGHGDEAFSSVIAQQAQRIVHLSNLYDNEHGAEFAQMISSAAPCSKLSCPGTGICHCNEKGRLDQGQVFFCNSGTEANEAALKFARKHGKGKTGVVSFFNAFHGRTMGALSATPNPKYQKPFLPLVPGFTHAKFNEKLELDENTCAVIVEPIQGEGGIFESKPEFLANLREQCDKVGALLIFDEVQCGVGRTGKLFAYQNYGVVPDIVTMAKPLANGIPIGAVLVSQQVASTLSPGDHGTTFGGSPFATAVGKHVWSRISNPEFLHHVSSVGDYFKQRLMELQQTSPLISEVRGRGLILGIQLRDTVQPGQFIDLCRDKGILVISAGSNTIRIVPSLIITKDQVDTAIQVFEGVISKMEERIVSGGFI